MENTKYEFKELNDLEVLLNSSKIPEDLKERTRAMLQRLNRMASIGNYSQDFEYTSNYIEWLVQLPFGVFDSETLDLQKTKEILDKNHYGLESVKSRVLEYIATRILLTNKLKEKSDLKNEMALKKAPILCMVGLQGVGKTTMAKSMAAALNRKFIRISLGGLGSTLELRGRNRSSAGAEPGQIVKSIIRTNSMNPVILLDELDKVSGEKGLRSDMMAIFLELLDPEQNTTFRDHYIDYPLDLSSVLFIVSANSIGTFSTALLDRLEVIKMPSYSDDEKTVIARTYLLPQIIDANGLTAENFVVEDAVWSDFIRPLGFDSGIRSLKKNLESIARKAAYEIVSEGKEKIVITPENFKKYLPIY
ncbi:AAA family ATPase [Patescibacteria group bacterium]|nr:AAA family ATPase [Patescibacteria group bacterium]